MKKSRKRFVLTLGALAATLLVAVVIALLPTFRELWSLHKLRDSPWLEERQHHAHLLAEMKSQRAVAPLLALLDEAAADTPMTSTLYGLEEVHQTTWRTQESLWPARILSELGAPAVPMLLERLDKDSRDWLTTSDRLRRENRAAAVVARILAEIGSEAVPAICDALKEWEKHPSRRRLVCTLGNMGAEAADAVPTLIQLLELEDQPEAAGELRNEPRALTRLAAWALGEIGLLAAAALPALEEEAKTNRWSATRSQAQAAADAIRLATGDSLPSPRRKAQAATRR